jgi:predicted negative regulator of RcsB-dependent stress response
MQAHDTPSFLLFKLWPQIEENKNVIFITAGVILAGTLIFSYVSYHSEQQEIAAGRAVTQVLMAQNPTTSGKQFAADILAVADQHAGTIAAVRAQLEGATALFNDGQYADAQVQFQKLLDSNAETFFRATAALGVAASLEAQGKSDLALTAYQRAASYSEGEAALAANFALGRLYEAAGKSNDAVNYYNRAAAAGNSEIGTEANARLAALNLKLAPVKPAATLSTPLTTPVPLTK